MRIIILCSWFLCLHLYSLSCQANANPNPNPNTYLCHAYGMNCQEIARNSSKALSKATATLQVVKRENLFADSANWSTPFYPRGLSERVLGISVEGDSVYALGMLSRADSTKTWGLAFWDGQKWSSPIKKPPFEIHSLSQVFKAEGKIYFCGIYGNEQPESRFLAFWDGKDWGMKSLPYMGIAASMTKWDGKLILASYMEGLWLIEDSLIAPFLPGLEGFIYEVASQGNKLWVRGNLLNPADSSRVGFAYLEDGEWSFPSVSKSKAGWDWAWIGQEVFLIMGENDFTRMDPTTVLRWDGFAWSHIVTDASVGLPRLLASDGKQVYLVGTNRMVGNNQARENEGLRISKWDGQKFTLVDSTAFHGRVYDAKAIKGRLILGGQFQQIGDLRADNLVGWDGNQWIAYSQQQEPGLVVPASAAVSWGNNLVFGGSEIKNAGNASATNITALNEAGWRALGKGIRSVPWIPDERSPLDYGVTLRSLAAHADRLYAGGKFDSAGNHSVRNIAQWDGQNWTPMGEGLSFEIDKLIANETGVYAISIRRDTLEGPGEFEVRDIAHWNGSSWKSLGSLPNYTYTVPAVYFNGVLWVGSGNGLAKWTGIHWEKLNLGIEVVTSLYAHKNALYLIDNRGKHYSYAGNSLDSLPGIIYASKMASDGENLFVYGQFDLPGFPNWMLARWNGKEWLPMAELETQLNDLIVHGDFLYLLLERPWDRPSVFDYYLRWNRNAGTWNRADHLIIRRGNQIKGSITCIKDCFLSERAGIHRVYDVRGRMQVMGLNAKKATVGTKVLERFSPPLP